MHIIRHTNANLEAFCCHFRHLVTHFKVKYVVFVHDTHLAFTVCADALANYVTQPSSDTVLTHYYDVIMIRWRLKSPASQLFTQPFIPTQIKENIQSSPSLAVHGEFTGNPHRWPVTRKTFPFDDVITSSCISWQITPLPPIDDVIMEARSNFLAIDGFGKLSALQITIGVKRTPTNNEETTR